MRFILTRTCAPKLTVLSPRAVIVPGCLPIRPPHRIDDPAAIAQMIR
jgi:hypothetical protein